MMGFPQQRDGQNTDGLLLASGSQPHAASVPPQEMQTGQALVLIVEDNREMSHFIARTLATMYRTVIAHDGQDGLSQALALEPDLILCDVVMPRMSGDELVYAVRAHPELDAIPIVLLSGRTDDLLRVKMLRAGAQDYLVKPFHPEELRGRVKNLIKMKQAHQLLQREVANQYQDIAALANEVTARARELQSTLDALREKEAFTGAILRTAFDAIITIDQQGHVIEWNATAEQLFGHSRAEVLGQEIIDLIIPSSSREQRRQGMLHYLALAEQHMLGQRFETTALRADGTEFPVELAITRIPLEGTAMFTTFIRDITERKRAEEAEQQLRAEAMLRASQLEAIFEAVTDGLYVYDAQGRVLKANSAGRRLLKLDAEADYARYSSHTFEERIALFAPSDEHRQAPFPEQWPLARVLGGEVLTGANTQDVVVPTGYGENIQLNFGGAPMYDQSGQIVGAVAVNRDVTERRKLERRTHEALDALLAMAQALVSIPAETSTTDRQVVAAREVTQSLAELAGRVLGCQRLSITDIEPESELFRSVTVFGISAEQEQQWSAGLRAVRLSDSPYQSLVSRLRAKEVVLLDMTQPPFDEHPNPHGVRSVLIAPMNIEDRLVGYLSLDHGGAAHDYTTDERAVAQAVAHFAALILERQRLLRERAEAESREMALRETNQRMDAFLGIASHELRTPLTSVIANVQLMERQFKRLADLRDFSQEDVTSKAEEAQVSLAEARRQLWRLNRLVSELLDVSRIQANKLTLQMERCDLAAIVRRAVDEQRRLNQARHFALEVRAAVPVLILADADRIGQVVTNYLTNALKYAPAHLPITVVLQEEEQEARVSVHDEGPGVASAEQERIWERFYRVKGIDVQSGSHVGLGLGLYICRTIIEEHRGQVGVQSMPGSGSIFWFSLPLVQQNEEGIKK